MRGMMAQINTRQLPKIGVRMIYVYLEIDSPGGCELDGTSRQKSDLKIRDNIFTF